MPRQAVVEAGVTVERKELKAALDEVKPAIASSGSTPELKHVWWDGTYLYGYNGALGIKVPWKWDLPPGGVLASVLLGVLDSSSTEQVSLASSAGSLTVRVGKATAKLQALESTANPWPFKAATKSAQFSVELTQELADGLKRARIIKASNPVRVEHYGIVLFPTKEFMCLYSTDSKTMVEVQVDGKFDKELNKLVLPHAYVQQILGLKISSQIYFMADAIVAVEEGGVQVCSNMLDVSEVWDLPKLAGDLAKDTEDSVIALPEGWQESLNRAGALAGSEESLLKLVVSPKNKEITLTGRLAYGTLEERLSIIGKVPGAGQITVELGALKALTRDAVSFSVGECALVINGKNQELLLIAEHEEERDRKPAREPERRAAPGRTSSPRRRAEMDDEMPF